MAMSWLKFVAASLWVRLSAGPRHELSYEHVAYDDGIAPKAADAGITRERCRRDTVRPTCAAQQTQTLSARFAAVRARVPDGPTNADKVRLPGETVWLIGE
jgi:hypothetical protein